MSSTAALRYRSESQRFSPGGIMGYQSANQSLALALARYANSDTLHCFARSRQEAQEFARIAKQGKKKSEWIPWTSPERLEEPGVVFEPGAQLGPAVWARRFVPARTFGVCGLIHTLGGPVTDRVARLLIDPFQPWDALICTSNAVRKTVARLHEQFAEYLSRRLGTTVSPVPPALLPTIPLGIHCDRFERTPQREAKGQQIRRELRAGADDVVVLYFGRMSWANKSNPYPMFRAIERVAKESSRTVHLVLAGFFTDKEVQRGYKAAAGRYCPSAKISWLDGCADQVRHNIWHAADVFISLVDNVQETFGLTPIEAMAAGLPCVITHWDGYAESVRDDLDGFHVPTALPPPGAGSELALRLSGGSTNLTGFLNSVAQSVIVDIDGATTALRRLVESPELRATMGASGRERALSTYDWSAVIPQYEALWAELKARRASAEEISPRGDGEPADPLLDDPYGIFASYPTRQFDLDCTVHAEPGAEQIIGQCRKDPVLAENLDQVVDLDRVKEIMAGAAEGETVRAIAAELEGNDAARCVRLIAWLAKVGAVRIEGMEAGEPLAVERDG